MAIHGRTIQCGVCGKTEREANYGDGWMGWGEFKGIVLNGDENPALCPQHLSELAAMVDGMASANKSLHSIR